MLMDNVEYGWWWCCCCCCSLHHRCWWHLCPMHYWQWKYCPIHWSLPLMQYNWPHYRHCWSNLMASFFSTVSFPFQLVARTHTHEHSLTHGAYNWFVIIFYYYWTKYLPKKHFFFRFLLMMRTGQTEIREKKRKRKYLDTKKIFFEKWLFNSKWFSRSFCFVSDEIIE